MIGDIFYLKKKVRTRWTFT